MINIIMRLFDVTASVLTIVSMYLVSKYVKAWLLYCVSCVFFVVVCYHNKLWGLTVMGATLFGIGIKNYIVGIRK